MNDIGEFERTEAGNLTDKGIRQYLKATIGKREKRIKELEADRAKLAENNDLLHEYIEQNRITQQAERIKELEVVCDRESGVLTEALKRKNNKSMIKVVAESLREQALKGGE